MKKYFIFILLFGACTSTPPTPPLEIETVKEATRNAFSAGWKYGFNACKQDKPRTSFYLDSLAFESTLRSSRPKIKTKAIFD